LLIKKQFSCLVAALQYAWIGRPDCVLFFGYGVGDDLLCSGVARELKKRGVKKIVLFSKHPSLFQGNPDISGVYNWGHPSLGRLQYHGHHCCVLQYGGYDPKSDRDLYANEHLLTTMCRKAGVTGTIQLHPRIVLSESEKEKGRLFERQAVIQSTGLGLYKNKDWFPERFQAVSDLLKSNINVIQLGLASDPVLAGTLDLRGKTNLRQSAAILANAQVFVGQVGFLMHLARAVNCRSVIVYGGRETPLVSGYVTNENIVGQTDCSPCWQRNRCDYDHACMKMIAVEEVYQAALRQMKKFGQPLPVETAEIGNQASLAAKK